MCLFYKKTISNRLCFSLEKFMTEVQFKMNDIIKVFEFTIDKTKIK